MDVLREKAKKIRLATLQLARKTGNGHIAPAFSSVELLISLYDCVLTEQDKFILSKGHGCLSLYAVLLDKGFRPEVKHHPDRCPEDGVEVTSGSLGHGMPMGVGMAFARKFKKEGGRVFVIIGDGESQEGTVWESAMLAHRFALDNLTVIVDHNKMQALAPITDARLREKFEAFGWDVEEVDGHRFEEIIPALQKKGKGAPRAVIAHTVKGKGVSFMENTPRWHNHIPEGELLAQALQELGGQEQGRETGAPAMREMKLKGAQGMEGGQEPGGKG